jgi:DEAD/DEAH box helicase domain-containing protein
VSNPGEFVSSLIGEETSVVDHSGASSPKRHFIFLKPILSPYTVAARLFVQGVESGLKTIAFTRARKITELITMWVTMEAPQLRNRVSSYRAGFTSEERRKIEARLFSGEMDGVISTSALEMGIDVGGLDLCLLVGYPGTIINTWQRGGRVGRGGRESAIVLIAGNDALDHYFLKHPDDFFGRNCERAVLDPLNREVLKRHIPCAAAEAPIRAEEEWAAQPEVRSVLEELEEIGTIYRTPEDDSWHAYDRRPHRGVDLRGIGEPFSIFLEDGKTLIGSSSGARVFSECHEGAVYLHRARQYLVTKLDLERRNIVVRHETLNYYTRGLSEKDTEILGAPLNSREFPGFVVREARLKVTEKVVAYEKRRTSSQELIGIVDLNLPPIHFETFGFWIEIPDRVKKAIQVAQLNFMGGIHALEHAAIAMFPLFALCDRDDVGGISTPQHQQVCRAAIFIYDGHPGGVGLAHHVFGLIEELLQKTHSLVGECQCEDGCPSCIHSPKCGSGNQPLDKKACLAVIQCLIDPEKGFADLGEMQSKQRPIGRLIVPGQEPERATPRANAGSPLPSAIRHPPSGNHLNLTETPYQTSGPSPKLVIFPDLRPGLDKQDTGFVGQGIDPYAVSEHESHAELISRPKEIGTHIDLDAEAEAQARGPARIVSLEAVPPRLVVFDLETRKLADEVGGWHNISAMRLSLAVAYSKEKGFLTFTEDNVSELIDLLKEADLVVGFNHIRFDYAVLKAYSAENLKALPNLDICTEVSRTLGFRLSLDHLARFTLEKGKSGDGLDAVRWFREGRMDLLEEYCREDVIITRDLYLFGLYNGYLNYRRKNGRAARIPVEWQGRGRDVRAMTGVKKDW